MRNREFRSDVQEAWLRKQADNIKVENVYMQRTRDMQRPTGEKFVNLVQIPTRIDMIKLTAKFAALSAMAMVAIGLAMMVML